MSRTLLKVVIAGVILMPALGKAQSSVDSASYRKAQILVNDGNAAAGRAIVDSLIARATPGSDEYVEGIYWRAVLSATASEAEMDYRRIIVDYPVSPRVEDVLLRLAQLELARADYAGALQHLNRLTLEHPTGRSRARADYWMARVLFEKNDTQHGCAATADALMHASPDDTELRNQITYLNQRCAGVVIAATPSTSATTPASDSTSGAKVDKPLSSGSAPPGTTGSVASDSAAKAVITAQKPPANTAAPKPRMPPPSTPRDAQPSMVKPMSKEDLAAASSASSKTTSEASGYSVQVAAYNVKKQAQAMAATLVKRGYEARVSGSSAPFRVRIGHYATEAQADAVKRSLKAKKIDGFVVKAESR
jgi:cell division protein FtsN